MKIKVTGCNDCPFFFSYISEGDVEAECSVDWELEPREYETPDQCPLKKSKITVQWNTKKS